jgi:glycosyltransferase involved in cell wall biosynthesis
MNMNNIVFIGPDNRDHRGGIGAVLDVYSIHLQPFRLIPTYVRKSFVQQLVTYVKAVFTLLWLCITDRSVKVLHIHHASKGSFMRKSVLMMIGKMFGKKIILHIHGAKFHIFYERSRLLKPVIRYCMENADVVICLSEQWKKFFQDTFRIRRLEIINNVVEEVKPFHHDDNDGRIDLLFLGEIGPRKGLFDLLDVLAAHRGEFRQRIRLTIGGIGQVERLQEMLKQKNFNGEIVYAGWVKGEKKAELLRNCDVYILPSYNEGLPISVLEAMSYGKPIVSTTVGGIPEVVKPGYNGWLFKPGDQDSLTTILKEIITKESELKILGENSRALTRDYTPGAVVQSLKTLYNQMN